MLKRRFSRAVTAKYLTLVNNADRETLSLWAEKLMDAKNIEDVFSGVNPLRS